MSDSVYGELKVPEKDVEKWDAIFLSLEKSGFGAKFQIALEELSEAAGTAFERVMEDNDFELGVPESWSRTGSVIRFEWDVSGYVLDGLIALFEQCGARDIRTVIPE